MSDQSNVLPTKKITRNPVRIPHWLVSGPVWLRPWLIWVTELVLVTMFVLVVDFGAFLIELSGEQYGFLWGVGCRIGVCFSFGEKGFSVLLAHYLALLSLADKLAHPLFSSKCGNFWPIYRSYPFFNKNKSTTVQRLHMTEWQKHSGIRRNPFSPPSTLWSCCCSDDEHKMAYLILSSSNVTSEGPERGGFSFPVSSYISGILKSAACIY